MQELKEVMQFLIENRGPLPPEFFDHPLKGERIDHRDCHVRGDAGGALGLPAGRGRVGAALGESEIHGQRRPAVLGDTGRVLGGTVYTARGLRELRVFREDQGVAG